MTTAKEIGTQLVSLCREGKNEQALKELYDPNIVSIEAMNPPGGQREQKGIDAIIGKNTWWAENHEVHSAGIEGPFPHGDDKFAVVFDYDVTFKPESKRMRLNEVGVYSVANGKITKEEYFYGT